MLKDICNNICQNKNALMLVCTGFYILALIVTFCEGVFVFAGILTIILILFLLKNIFPAKYILIWGLIFYLGVINTSLRLKETDELLNIAPVNSVISGKILSIPQSNETGKTKFFFKVCKIEYDSMVKEFDDEKVLVTLNTKEKLKIYDSYKITGRLSTPFKAGNPSQFDYGNYLRNFDTYAVFYAKTFSKYEADLSLRENFLQRINNYREKIIDIHSQYLKSPNLEILGGIVFGDDAVPPPQYIKDSFINSGLLHILAASGMNVAFIFSFFFFFISLFKVNYKLNISFCILMVIIYSLMTGLGASVVRAACMLIFVLAGKLIDRDAHSIALLSFVALLMLIYNPMYINDVSFQLSFISTFGLLVMTPCLVRYKNKFINWTIGTITTPIIAQLWVTPIQIFYFNNITLYSVFANIMSVPILSAVSFGGFISSLLAPITPHFVCCGIDFVLNPMISFIVNISDFCAKLPYASLQTTHPNVFQITIYYTILLIITAFLNKEFGNKYKKLLGMTLLILIFVLMLSIIPKPNKNLEITAFDVGNADAFLIKTPENEYIMIDTAKSGYNGGKSQAEFLILKYLKDRGIKNIKTIIVTHFDNDHCGGAVDLINGVKVDNLYVNSLDHSSKAAKNIYETARNRGVNLIPGQNGQIVMNNPKIINFITPYMHEYGDNEASILTLLEYGNFKMLFTGDSGVKAFNELKQYLPQNIAVLKVGHHGASGTVSRNMLEYLNPEVALISVGENKFGHPNIYTLSLLENTNILRTDINNSVKFVVGQNGWTVYTYDIKKKKYKKKLLKGAKT